MNIIIEQIIVNDISKNKKKKGYEKDETSAFYDYVIQPSNRRFQIWFENIKIKKWVSDFNWWKQSKIIKHFM